MKYLKLINKIIQGKIKINFSSLKNNKLVIFDGVSFPDLEFLLDEFDYKILENRFERINELNLSPKIIYYLISNFISLSFEKKKIRISELYFYTILKLIKPKVVITSIDNSMQFHRLAKFLENKFTFIAVQNANRLDYVNNEYLIKNSLSKIDYNSQLYIPNFICFGEAEEKSAISLNLNIKNFFKYGSIRTANFFYYINKKKLSLSENLYDICLISELVYGFNLRYKKNFIEEGIGKLASYTIRFAIEKNLNFLFASKYKKKNLLV